MKTKINLNQLKGGGSGGGPLASNENMLFKVGTTNTALTSPQILQFADKLFVYDSGSSSGPAPYMQFGSDASTGAIIQETAPNFFPLTGGYSNYTGRGLSTSEDGQTLYALTIEVQAFGANPKWTLRAYNTSLTLIATSSYVGSASLTGQGAVLAFFVTGSHLVVESQPSSGGDGYWTDFTIAGAALTTPTATNLKFFTFSGSVHVDYICATYKQGNVYMQPYSGSSGIGDGIEKRSYSAATFGSVADTNFEAIPDFTYGSNVIQGGFEIPSSTTIGRWRNTSFYVNQTGGGSPPTINYLSAIFNEYTF